MSLHYLSTQVVKYCRVSLMPQKSRATTHGLALCTQARRDADYEALAGHPYLSRFGAARDDGPPCAFGFTSRVSALPSVTALALEAKVSELTV